MRRRGILMAAVAIGGCTTAPETVEPAAEAVVDRGAKAVSQPAAGSPALLDSDHTGADSPQDEAGTIDRAVNTTTSDTAGDDDSPLLDRTREGVYSFVNSTSRWFDGFFGSTDLQANPDANVSRGLLALGGRWDERDDFTSSVRFRAQIPLPALRKRTRLLLGRGDTDDIVDGSETETINALPEQFSDFTDDDWLLGLGYRGQSGMREGFDFGIGASIRGSTVDPYARVTYRFNRPYGERWLWRIRPRLFWQEERGEGASINSILDFVASEEWLVRSRATVVTDQLTDGLRWKKDLVAYQSLSNRSALSYRVFAIGETDDEVTLQDYGFELRFRRRMLREWFYIELSAGVTWPRELLIEQRQSNIGAGLEFEMQFGDWPGRRHSDDNADMLSFRRNALTQYSPQASALQ